MNMTPSRRSAPFTADARVRLLWFIHGAMIVGCVLIAVIAITIRVPSSIPFVAQQPWTACALALAFSTVSFLVVQLIIIGPRVREARATEDASYWLGFTQTMTIMRNATFEQVTIFALVLRVLGAPRVPVALLAAVGLAGLIIASLRVAEDLRIYRSMLTEENS